MAGRRARALGELEAEVLRLLRSADVPLSAKEIVGVFSEPRPAYTTVLTVLDRLQVKGQVDRVVFSPRKLRFRATTTAEESASDSMLTALSTVDDRSAALMMFAGRLDDTDVAFLRDALKARHPPE